MRYRKLLQAIIQFSLLRKAATTELLKIHIICI